jgi:hypothetical protein
MEKLIMLIDIYEEEVVWVHSVWEKITDKEEARIISKKFWFIKWLVENEKIDKSKVFSFIDTADTYEDILCLLALSDEPINDLISFLK